MAKAAGKKTPPAKKNPEDNKKYLCHYCLKEKKKTEFYMSTDPLVLSGITSICKDCTKKIKGLFKSKKAKQVKGGTLILETPYMLSDGFYSLMK